MRIIGKNSEFSKKDLDLLQFEGERSNFSSWVVEIALGDWVEFEEVFDNLISFASVGEIEGAGGLVIEGEGLVVIV